MYKKKSNYYWLQSLVFVKVVEQSRVFVKLMVLTEELAYKHIYPQTLSVHERHQDVFSVNSRSSGHENKSTNQKRLTVAKTEKSRRHK